MNAGNIATPVRDPGRVESDPMVIRVLIAEEKALYAGALARLLSTQPDLQVVATVLTDADLSAAIWHTGPDIVLLDIDGRGRTARQLSMLSTGAAAHARVIALTAGNPPATLQLQLRQCTWGLVDKQAGCAALFEAIRQVAVGRRVTDTRFTTGDGTPAPLTRRELELLQQVSGGHPVGELATALRLAESTIRNHLTSARKKLGARSLIDAIRIAQHAGWM